MSRLTINSNISSLNTQRSLLNATKKISDSFTKLSSGLRINKASDDAAGLSVATLLTADKRVTNQAIRNLNDGVSYLNVAEGALNELSNIVTRISELAEQGANGTLGNKQRESLQQEVTSLQSEYNRIIRSTSFNGNQLLTGTTTNTLLQGGYGADAQLEVQVGTESLGIANDLTRAGLTTRIDTDSAGNVGNNISEVTAISADGRYVAFQSNATNLVSGDTNLVQDSFIKDTQTGITTRISTNSAGNQANGTSTVTAISADGRYVAFWSNATNLVSGDTNLSTDSFIKDMQTGITTRISTDSAGNQGNGNSTVSAISADGRFIAFNSNASNLVSGDTNLVQDSFIKDTQTGITTRISTDSSGSEGNNSSTVSAISADGRYVAFHSIATNLVSGDTNLTRDSFIKDTQTGITTRISTNSAGNQGNNQSQVTAISADGRYVAFWSFATTLVSGDTNGVQDSFIKDTQTGITTRISTDSSGNQGNGNSTVSAISADGRYVAFYSQATNLVSGDTNGVVEDSFIKDTQTGITTRISTDSSGNQGNNNSLVNAISANGRYAVYYDQVVGISYLRDLSQTGVQEISGMVVSNQASAKITLDLSKKYQDEISQYRAGIGVSLSRASTFINSLQVQSENYEAAASQITDIDVAEESSRLAATQILQQSAASILAQANLQPRLVLSLLGDL